MKDVWSPVLAFPLQYCKTFYRFLGLGCVGISSWLAGAGIMRGSVYGATDEHGVRVARDGVHVHDLHATILHLLGIDHTRLTFRHAGRDFRLTDVAGNVVHGALA